MAGAQGRIDYFAVANSLAWLPVEPIRPFRQAHYPTAHLIEPHLTLVFPVPAAIGMDPFREHVREVVSRTRAFDIRLAGLDKSWDHWLFLAVSEGVDKVIALHDALYEGILLPYLWTEQPYVPHVGLGHFAQEQDTRDPLTIRPREFDKARFDEARREAEALQLDYTGRFDSVHIFGLDEDHSFGQPRATSSRRDTRDPPTVATNVVIHSRRFTPPPHNGPCHPTQNRRRSDAEPHPGHAYEPVHEM